MIEQWLDIVGYEGRYRVSNFGNVYSYPKGRNNKNGCFLKPGLLGNGYYSVSLKAAKSIKNCRVNRLVAIAFIPNPLNKPQVNHIDGNKLNNTVKNLEWCTCKENIKHSIETGLGDFKGTKNARCKLSEAQVLNIRKTYSQGGVSHSVLAAEHNVSKYIITSIINRKNWKHI